MSAKKKPLTRSKAAEAQAEASDSDQGGGMIGGSDSDEENLDVGKEVDSSSKEPIQRKTNTAVAALAQQLWTSPKIPRKGPEV